MRQLRVVEGLARQHQHPVGACERVDRVVNRRQPELGAGVVQRSETAVPAGARDAVQHAIAQAPEGAGRGRQPPPNGRPRAPA